MAFQGGVRASCPCTPTWPCRTPVSIAMWWDPARSFAVPMSTVSITWNARPFMQQQDGIQMRSCHRAFGKRTLEHNASVGSNPIPLSIFSRQLERLLAIMMPFQLPFQWMVKLCRLATRPVASCPATKPRVSRKAIPHVARSHSRSKTALAGAVAEYDSIRLAHTVAVALEKSLHWVLGPRLMSGNQYNTLL